MDSSASNFVYAVATLTFSGSYPAGGDTLDFTTVAEKWPMTQIVQVFAEIAKPQRRLLRAGAGKRHEQLDA